MGWCGGSSLFQVIIDQAIVSIPDGARAEFYKPIIEAFKDEDWDTQCECMGFDPEFDALILSTNPDDWEFEPKELKKMKTKAEKYVQKIRAKHAKRVEKAPSNA